jgi:nitroimidazol reductase NimA-like FMN-containing flavoprotein (pyridoxamine 5'-phosphate oxidase superfamily)
VDGTQRTSVAIDLDRRAIDEFLGARFVGRIGCSLDGEPYVVPVVYAYDGRAFYVASSCAQAAAARAVEAGGRSSSGSGSRA